MKIIDGALVAGLAIPFDELLFGAAVFGILWFSDNRIALFQGTRIVAEADQLRQTGRLLQKSEMGEII